MGQGRPTSRPSNYVTDLEILLETKNEQIAQLQSRIEELKDEVLRVQKVTAKAYDTLWCKKERAENKVKELEARLALYDMPSVQSADHIVDLRSRIEAALKLADELESSHLYGYADKLREALGGKSCQS